MIIYNTTYQIEASILEDVLYWFKSSLIPKIMDDGTLTSVRLLRVMVNEKEMGHCYSLQFNVSNEDLLNDWFSRCGSKILSEINLKYQSKVLGFTTLLEVIDI